MFASIDKRMEANVGNEGENTSKEIFISFLSLIQYKDIPSDQKVFLVVVAVMVVMIDYFVLVMLVHVLIFWMIE